MAVDVTAEVYPGEIDGELLPLTRCICGMEWPAWEGPILRCDPEDPYECPECHVKLFFTNKIRVWAVEPLPLAITQTEELDIDINTSYTPSPDGDNNVG